MKIKYTLTLFCVTLALAFLLVSCADTQGGGGGGDITEKQFSNVSAESCGDSTLELNCFISVWKTENSSVGTSDTSTVVLPLVEGGTYDFYVNWGDGKEVEKITSSADATHTYTTPGEYTIHIAGIIKGWRFHVSIINNGDATKLLNVEQWGSLSLGNTPGGQFFKAINFNPTATDAPDLSETTDLSYAFAYANSFNGEIGNWDVSQITDMFSMFVSASAFNQDISGWNVRQVTSMSTMFKDATSFNNGDEKLDWGDKTSNVTNMTDMFNEASAFNQDICYWNVGNVTQSPPVGFANVSALDNKNNPFDAECTARKSN